MDEFSFEKLQAYQHAKVLTKEVYNFCRNFPEHERFALCSQIRRAIVSVPSNIAEGCGRRSLKEKIHFIEIAFGSLYETYCQLEIATDLGYSSMDKLMSIKPKFLSLSRMLNSLSKSYEEKLNLK